MKFLSLFSFLLLAGCGNPLGPRATTTTTVEPTFHPGSPPAVPEVPRAEQPRVGAASGAKLGPGAMRSAGLSVSAQAVVLPDNHLMKGSQLSGRFSLNRFKPR